MQYTVVGPFWIAYSQIINAEVSDANVIWISFEIYKILTKTILKIKYIETTWTEYVESLNEMCWITLFDGNIEQMQRQFRLFHAKWSLEIRLKHCWFELQLSLATIQNMTLILWLNSIIVDCNHSFDYKEIKSKFI